MSSCSYPPTYIDTDSDDFNILQITDMHLYYKDVRQPVLYERFENVLNQALNESMRFDLILISGDLINEMDARIYDDVFVTLGKTGIPFACISGNHDVTDEVGADDIPFHEKQLVAYPLDKRLLNKHVIETDFWQLLLLDSSVPGKVGGKLTSDELQWIKQQLSTNAKPALLCLHHHVVPMQSAWIDEHMLENSDELWNILSNFSHVKVVTFGHVHQEFYASVRGVDVYGTPATSYQFQPKQYNFAIDPYARPGYRLFSLSSKGTHTSIVRRLSS